MNEERRLPTLQYSLVCLGVDDQHGPPSLQHVVHELPLPAFPYRFPETSGFFLVNGWTGGQGDFAWAARLYDPDGRILRDTGTRISTLASPEHPFLSVHFLQAFEFPRPGVYRIEVILEGRRVMEYPLTATLAPR